MAGEIQFDHATGKTCYALIRNAVGQVWNGAAFVNYVTANLAAYAVACAEQGTASGYYAGTFPAAAAGYYNVLAKEQAGGSAAETDFSVGLGSLYWDGAAVPALPALDTSQRVTVAAFKAGAVTDAAFTVPAEVAGAPTGVLARLMWAVARLGLRRVKKDKAAGTITVFLANGTSAWTASTYTTTLAAASDTTDDVSAGA